MSPGPVLGLASRWSPSTMKRDKSLRNASSPIISAPIAILSPVQLGQSTFTPPTPSPPDTHTNTLRSPSQPTPKRSPSRSKLLNYVRSKVATSSPPPTSSIPTRPTRRGMNSALAPISSSDLPPPRLPLDELEIATVDGDRGKEEKLNKVLAWWRHVGNNETLSKLEEMMEACGERTRGFERDCRSR